MPDIYVGTGKQTAATLEFYNRRREAYVFVSAVRTAVCIWVIRPLTLILSDAISLLKTGPH